MNDLKYVRENIEGVTIALKRRGFSFDGIAFSDLDEKRRFAIAEVEKLKAEKNQLSKQVGDLMRQKNAPVLAGASNEQTIINLKEDVSRISEKIKEKEIEANKLDQKLIDYLQNTPNLPANDVPDGLDAESNKLVRSWGQPPVFNDFLPKPHWEIGIELDILDWEKASKITGARFTVYKGLGARLERALIQFMLDYQTEKNGYKEHWVPLMVNSDSLFGTGQLPKFKEDLFKIFNSPPQTILEEMMHKARRASDEYNGSLPEKESKDVIKELLGYVEYVNSPNNGYYLIPTAEVPLTNLHRDDTFEESELPIKYCGYTPCFRSEAGAYGKDTKGMVRQHQFNKVELVKFTTPEQSEVEHEKLVLDAEGILQALSLPYQTLLLCAGDMGFGARKCYDIEVYAAGQDKKWWECSSCSNFGDFQARRANIKVKLKDGKKVFAHTLNGSGLATSRVLPAILENNQQADGSVVIPEVLRKYMGGLQRITKA